MFLAPLPTPVETVAADRAALIRGVDRLVAPGALPGAVVASKDAFVVLRSGDKPIFVAGPMDRGRVIVGGHGAFFGPEPLRNPGNAHFFANALTWLGRKSSGPVRVGFLEMGGAVEAAKSVGAETVNVSVKEVADGLLGLDVLCTSQGALDRDPAAQTKLVAWVRQGHGLLITGPAWGWQQLNPGKSLRTDLSANRMLVPFGFGLSGETVDGEPVPTGAEDPLLQTDSALAALRQGGLTPANSGVATGTVARALSIAPIAEKGLAAEIRTASAAEGPASTLPITDKMPFSRLRAVLDDRAWEEAVPERVRANPTSVTFPGPVPAAAKRVSRTVEVDTKVPQWHGSGLYAAPGEVVTVTLPDGAEAKGLGVRIGNHTDELWHLPKWDRFPAISRRWPLENGVTKIASPFGGTVFVDVPEGATLGTISVGIAGAVPAPRYVRGVTTADEWSRMLAEPGGPWAELEARGVILSVPRSAVANLKDPEALMAFWDEMMDRCYELYAAPRRARPERYSVDRQISAGYMHSGYPIMTFEDVANTFTDVTKLRGRGATWGFYHEVGHNFQERAWSFDGTGEVTNNLFSLYGSERINGITPPEYGVAHPAMAPDAQRKRLTAYLEKGASFETWKSDPFLALTMYSMVREQFGWAPFTKAFGEYRRLNLRPRGETGAHDAWMVQLSRATGRDLSAYFVAWGVPTSETARRSLASLPTWMPADWPKGGGSAGAANGAG